MPCEKADETSATQPGPSTKRQRATDGHASAAQHGPTAASSLAAASLATLTLPSKGTSQDEAIWREERAIASGFLKGVACAGEDLRVRGQELPREISRPAAHEEEPLCRRVLL